MSPLHPKIILKNKLAKYIFLKVVNTQFLLSTRDQFVATRLNLEDAQMVRPEPKVKLVLIKLDSQVEEAGYKGDRPTKIIVHGFLDTGQEVWVKVGGSPKDD